MTLHTYSPQPETLESKNFLHLMALESLPEQDLKVEVFTARSKVKSRSHHDVTHLHSQP